MMRIPEVVTHRYDPAVGICPNICSLSDIDASRILDKLREEFRPNLKPAYLSRRRDTELWLSQSASALLGQQLRLPGYFFLGDFSYGLDQSRPAALVIPLSVLPVQATTFTLGDSMTIAAQADRRLYRLSEMSAVLAVMDNITGIGFTDRNGYQSRFIEIQVWDRSFLITCTDQGERTTTGREFAASS